MPRVQLFARKSQEAIKRGGFDRLDFCAKTVVHAVHVFSSCDEPMARKGGSK